MDSSDPRGSTSAATFSNGENEKKDSTMIQTKHARFFKTYQRQNYSLPDSIMFFITKNPTTPILYQKMIQTCKDFFVKNPVLVISDLFYEGDKWYINGEAFDLDNLTSKFWITSKFIVRTNDSMKTKAVNENIASSIIPKICRCDVKCLTLNDQILSFADLSRVSSTADVIYLDNVTVKENDGSIVGIEKIVDVAVKAKNIEFIKPHIVSVTSKTMKELIKIQRFCKLDRFCMNHIPEAFDIEAFYIFMKNRLEEILDEIIAPETFGYKLPFLTFPGMSEEKENELFNILTKTFHFINVVG